jgi:hypothetical protein
MTRSGCLSRRVETALATTRLRRMSRADPLEGSSAGAGAEVESSLPSRALVRVMSWGSRGWERRERSVVTQLRTALMLCRGTVSTAAIPALAPVDTPAAAAAVAAEAEGDE